MPLLDHKYEVLRQRALNTQQTLFEATAPDGTAVSIVWFEFDGPQDELVFERYRQLLRALRSEGRAAIYDLVSRPGAHYVAWIAGGRQRAKPAPKDGEVIGDILGAYGYDLQAADLRWDFDHSLKVFGLSFDGSLTTPLPYTPPRPRARPPSSRSLSWPLELLPGWLLAWLPGLLLALFGTLFLLTAFSRQTTNRVITVPPVLGLEVNEAAARLYELGLAVTTEAIPASETPGEVLGLEPPVGANLRPGRQVRLRYAAPAGQLPPVEVPNLVEQRYLPELAQTLEAAGLVLGRVAHLPSDSPQGVVLAQSHPAGEPLPRGSTLHLLVSTGPKPELTFLPPLVGLELGLAIDLARDAGISAIEEDYDPGSRAPVGTVVGQNIAPYTYVPSRRTTLRLLVAGHQSLPETSGRTVPDLISMPRQRAVETLEQARFRVGRLETVSLGNMPEGVLAQTPPPGAAPQGNTIDLTVNVHPRRIGDPGVSVRLVPPEPREVPYRLSIEAGIPARNAELYATTADGETVLVLRRRLSGGDTLEGVWTTDEPGPVVFELRLNGFSYRELRVNP